MQVQDRSTDNRANTPVDRQSRERADTLDIEAYFAAGVATTPMFMERLREGVHRALTDRGASVRSGLVFPYGDRERSLWTQLREVGRDMRLRYGRIATSIGGNRLMESLERMGGARSSARTLLIGHSAGGVAAVQAAEMLLARSEGRGPAPLVVMIGSPRCRIPERLRDSVLYVYAEKPAARGSVTRPADPITRLGTFGGWRAGKFYVPRWIMDKHGPQHHHGVRIIGKHPDYFREEPPYVNDLGLSNLTLTIDIVLRWLERRI